MSWAQGGGETVLIAEDTGALRDVLVDLLGKLGYRVLAASTGEEALDIAAAERVDLLLTDVRMPGISGLEVAKRLGSVPVLFMTGFSPDECDVPAEHLLEKPFSPRVLAHRVRERLDGPATRT
jgi:CheY-like chemotaxis protein